jgi:hypothetical protein
VLKLKREILLFKDIVTFRLLRISYEEQYKNTELKEEILSILSPGFTVATELVRMDL